MKFEPQGMDDNLFNEIILWARAELIKQGYIVDNTMPENILETPWSQVLRFTSSLGYIYLKRTPKLIALEAKITLLLRNQFRAHVPEVIAYNSTLDCFLMKDAGNNFRGILKKQFDVNLLSKAVSHFTQMQHDVSDHLAVFLEMGVPDWRLTILPNLYMTLLTKKDILIADGLQESEISKLVSFHSEIKILCEKLSTYSIKQTIVQSDFHDNNILFDKNSQHITFIDLGEIVISHPFFSLVGFFHQMKKHYHLTENDPAYLRLMDTAFENFLPFESIKNLKEAFAIAKIVWSIYDALAQCRLRDACNLEKFLLFQRRGRLSGALKELIENISSN